jgi:hypothetical protein
MCAKHSTELQLASFAYHIMSPVRDCRVLEYEESPSAEEIRSPCIEDEGPLGRR